MPVNAGPEYYKAQRKYSRAKTTEEKIAALKEMIKALPKHKGAENLLADLRKRLSKLKKEKDKKTVQAKPKPKFIVRKEGAAQVCIVGPTNSGKSSLLKALTNADVEVADYSYTTAKPEVGMMKYTGVGIQLVEIPSTFTSDVMSIVHTCDLVLILLDGTKDLEKQLKEVMDVMDEHGIGNKKVLIVAGKSDKSKNEAVFQISSKAEEGLEELKNEIWDRLDLIRVYTKSPDSPRAENPIGMEKDSTVKDVVKEVHKTLLDHFRFARIFNDTKHSGIKVGLDYELSDMDTVEIHGN